MNAPYRQSSFPPPPRSSSARPEAGPDTTTRVRLLDSGFVPDAVLDAWLRAGEATRAGAILALRAGPQFYLSDAVRILGRRNGDTDPYGFTGRVEAIRELIRQGATVTPDAVRLGPAVYDAEFGVIAQRVRSADESGPHPQAHD